MSFTFCESLWSESKSILNKIYSHPFNRELTQGTLPQEKFQYYLRQDSLYLVDFARALATTATKVVDVADMTLLLRFADGALTAERGLHQYYFDLYGMKGESTQSDSCLLYTQFLLATASYADSALSMAALLPCFWVYREVGKRIFKESQSSNPYSKWIETYSGNEFEKVVERAIQLTEKFAARSTQTQREKMRELFKRSCEMEWQFWEGAYLGA